MYSFRRWHWFVIDRRRCRVFCRFVVYFGRWKIILILHWFVVNLRGRGILHRLVVNLKLQSQKVLMLAKLFFKSKIACRDMQCNYRNVFLYNPFYLGTCTSRKYNNKCNLSLLWCIQNAIKPPTYIQIASTYSQGCML